ncbi:MAG: hypothetical protein KatS3mg003_0836 [Candidatus Nitrosocaldaceae archaeon]|nr:MAG: hypothetical protein KatS3mg003_0836 [Candidatus Nitrosocaldaceae archaeon]
MSKEDEVKQEKQENQKELFSKMIYEYLKSKGVDEDTARNNANTILNDPVSANMFLDSIKTNIAYDKLKKARDLAQSVSNMNPMMFLMMQQLLNQQSQQYNPQQTNVNKNESSIERTLKMAQKMAEEMMAKKMAFDMVKMMFKEDNNTSQAQQQPSLDPQALANAIVEALEKKGLIGSNEQPTINDLISQIQALKNLEGMLKQDASSELRQYIESLRKELEELKNKQPTFPQPTDPNTYLTIMEKLADIEGKKAAVEAKRAFANLALQNVMKKMQTNVSKRESDKSMIGAIARSSVGGLMDTFEQNADELFGFGNGKKESKPSYKP